MTTIQDFTNYRFGMFIHFGLYSNLGRGEWAMNRERISTDDLRALSGQFTAERFDAGALCDLAVEAGMRYIILTSMHHDGFRLYRSELSDFSSWTTCGRDLCAETIAAARERGLGVGLYHSLNNWFERPDAVDALEDKAAWQVFIANTHARVEELVRNYDFDILWYDGWWPFDGEGWQGEALNAKLRSIRPGLLFNPRNGAEGDFATPEQHLSAPVSWRPWEGCMTLNDNWGFHRGDDNWKSPKEVIKLLCKAAAGNGNLLLNVGPRGDGSLPEQSAHILREVGGWIARCGECLRDNSVFTFDLEHRDHHTGDWCHHGPMTASGNCLYMIATSWPGNEWTLSGLDAEVISAELLPSGDSVAFERKADGVFRFHGLPQDRPDPLAPVFRIRCDRPPTVYNCGGMRTPSVPHPPYDPMPSDVAL
jgi:alpha-L-fucosidase